MTAYLRTYLATYPARIDAHDGRCGTWRYKRYGREPKDEDLDTVTHAEGCRRAGGGEVRRPRILFDGFTGSGAFTLAAVGPVSAPVGYMGAKRSLAPIILATAGLRCGVGADLVVLCDAGPWGDAWKALSSRAGAHAVADVLDGWAVSMTGPIALWDDLAALPPFSDEARRVSQFLWLQGRAASATPIWWDAALRMWRMSVGRANAEPSTMAQRGVWSKARPGACTGLTTPATVASRVRAIGNVLAGCDVRVVHGDISEALALLPEDLTDTLSYLDPPYHGATRYAGLCARERVLGIARDLDGRRSLVLVSEGEPISLPGWPTADLSAARSARWTARQRGEWLTMNRTPAHRVATQPSLFKATA